MRVLISRPDKIGDVVLALHGAKQLKRLLPEVELFIHASTYTKPLVENINFVDGVITCNEGLETYNFSALVDLMAKRESAKLYTGLENTIKIGNSARWFSYIYDRTRYIRRSKALLNEAEYNWQLISLLSPTLKNTLLTDSLGKEDFINIKSCTDVIDRIVIMPGISASALAWPENNWQELAILLAKSELPVLILLGPAEKDLILDYAKLTDKSGLIKIKQVHEISELLGVLQVARQYVGTSTGVTHLASAMGAKGLALYPEQQSMHPSRWLPFNTQLKCLALSDKLTVSDVYNSLTQGFVKNEVNPLHRENVSAFVVCCNEEKNIKRCLDSIKWCDEIIIVDSGSRDKTLEIAKTYTNKIYFRPWTGHSEQKQFALDQCQYPWILNIDSDEEVSMELKAQLLSILRQATKSKYSGYHICRVVNFLDRWWERGGWFPEYRLRFFRRANTSWGGVNPHEKAIVIGKTKKIHQPIYHFTYQNFSHQIETLNKHSSLSAECLYKEGKRCYLHNIILNPISRFFKFYLFKLGFREGKLGFIVAVLEAYYTFIKYVKLWELEQSRIKSQSNYKSDTKDCERSTKAA